MSVEFTEAEKRELVRLLAKVRENDCFFPTEDIMRAFHGTISMWSPELVIAPRNTEGRRQVLLARYDGGIEEFRGVWHIPGGYNKFFQRDIQETCSAVALRELGVDVAYEGVLDAYKWQDHEHPYGHPLSLYVACRPCSEIAETDALRYFSLFTLPRALLAPHRRFLESFLKQ